MSFVNPATSTVAATEARANNILPESGLFAAVEAGEFSRAIAQAWLGLLSFLNDNITTNARAELESLTGSVPLERYIERLRRALDPIEAAATACMLAAAENAPCCSGEEPPEPTPEQQERAEEHLLREALYPFHALSELREAVQRQAAGHLSVLSAGSKDLNCGWTQSWMDTDSHE